MSASVFFRVKCSTEFSQMIRIVGNTPQLGCWDPLKGFPLITNDQMYPLWFNDYALQVDAYQYLEFKIVITDGCNYYWESGTNRCMAIKFQKQVVILTFDSLEMQVCGLQKLFSDNDLTTIVQGCTRKISLSTKDWLCDQDQDSDSERESDLLSLIKDDTISLNSHENPTSPSQNYFEQGMQLFDCCEFTLNEN